VTAVLSVTSVASVTELVLILLVVGSAGGVAGGFHGDANGVGTVPCHRCCQRARLRVGLLQRFIRGHQFPRRTSTISDAPLALARTGERAGFYENSGTKLAIVASDLVESYIEDTYTAGVTSR